MIGPVSHDPQRLKEELLRTFSPVIFDTETTGLNVRSDRALSYGFRVHVDGRTTNHILFTQRCTTTSIAPHASSPDAISSALEPLDRPGLILVGHNIKYDLLMLRREGFDYRGEVRDTQGILKVLDQDRGFSSDGESKQQTAGRRDLGAPVERRWLNYHLKDAAAQLCQIQPLHTPSDNMDLVDYHSHTLYLAHDLFVTDALYRKLWPGLTRRQRIRYRRTASPLIQLLCDLTDTGVAADADFLAAETERLSVSMAAISEEHKRLYGRSLQLSDQELRELLYVSYALPCRRRKGKKPPVGVPKLLELKEKTTSQRIRHSLQLIIGYREVTSLRNRLRDYLAAIDSADGRIHSSFDENKQVTGRISSVEPNLQQIARTKSILPGSPLSVTVKSRNFIVASPSCMLIGADIDQADLRVLADRIGSCQYDTSTRLRQLHRRRWSRLGRLLAPYEQIRQQSFNANWRGQTWETPPDFDPDAPSRLVEDFCHLDDDLYAQIASNVTGQTITKRDPERSLFKTVILAQVNGQTPTGLAKTLGCSEAKSRHYVGRFFAAYPDVAGYLALLRQEVAISGQVTTWSGRQRMVTAHRWMVDEPKVRVLLTYKDGHHYWFEVSPIRPTLRNLTCFVHRVWSVHDPQGPKSPKLIYQSNVGRIGTRFYKQLDEPGMYRLPIRNLPWSNIRRVRKLDKFAQSIEEVKYEGFDATARSAINTVMQGGTADITVAMSLRCRDIVRRR